MFINLPKEEKKKEFIVTKGGEGYLAVFEIVQWNMFEEKLNDLPIVDKNARLLRRHFLGSAENVETNEDASMVISDALYYFAGGQEGKSVTVYGVEECQNRNINIMHCIEEYAKYILICE